MLHIMIAGYSFGQLVVQLEHGPGAALLGISVPLCSGAGSHFKLTFKTVLLVRNPSRLCINIISHDTYTAETLYLPPDNYLSHSVLCPNFCHMPQIVQT